MNRILCVLCLTVAAVCSTAPRAQERKPVDTSTFMRMKLEHAQGVLEGLALEDYELIAKHGQAMVLLSHESNWTLIQSADYNLHSADFRRTAGQMVKHAREKNLDAVALDYVLMSTNCVNCHKYVRQWERETGRKPGK